MLKVQIPDEPSDEGSVTANSTSASSPSGTNGTSSNSNRNGNTTDSLSSGVVLPPPSPSAGSLMSKAIAGPRNPFARPHPVSQSTQPNTSSGSNCSTGSGPVSGSNNTSSNANTTSNNTNGSIVDTPVSALPSRFMTNDFLPSPSSFYPEWNFRGGDSNTLPSPLNFATPVVGTGPSFIREESSYKEANESSNVKRKTPEIEGDAGDTKRAKIN